MILGILDFGKAPPIGGLEPACAQPNKGKIQEINELLHGPASFGQPPNR